MLGSYRRMKKNAREIGSIEYQLRKTFVFYSPLRSVRNDCNFSRRAFPRDFSLRRPVVMDSYSIYCIQLMHQ